MGDANMSDPYVVDVGTGKAETKPFTDEERAELEAFQADITARAAAEEAARAAIVYGSDPIDLADLALVKSYVQASRTFLTEAPHTQASVAAQTERNTKAILAILRRLV